MKTLSALHQFMTELLSHVTGECLFTELEIFLLLLSAVLSLFFILSFLIYKVDKSDEDVSIKQKTTMNEKHLVKLTSPKNQGEQLVRKFTIGRNSPCPCGSGKKWKHCDCEEYHGDTYIAMKHTEIVREPITYPNSKTSEAKSDK